jgi:hypothetical protein
MERFEFDAPLPKARADAEAPVDLSEHVVAVRVYDRYDNVVTVKTIVK